MSKQKFSQKSCLSFIFIVPKNTTLCFRRANLLLVDIERKPPCFYQIGHGHPVGPVKSEVILKGRAPSFGDQGEPS